MPPAVWGWYLPPFYGHAERPQVCHTGARWAIEEFAEFQKSLVIFEGHFWKIGVQLRHENFGQLQEFLVFLGSIECGIVYSFWVWKPSCRGSNHSRILQTIPHIPLTSSWSFYPNTSGQVQRKCWVNFPRSQSDAESETRLFCHLWGKVIKSPTVELG